MELPNVEEEDEEDEMVSGEDEEDVQGTQFCMELECDHSHLSLSTSPTGLGLIYSKKQVMKNEQAEKLDVMMTVCFQYLHMVCHHKNGALEPGHWSVGVIFVMDFSCIVTTQGIFITRRPEICCTP